MGGYAVLKGTSYTLAITPDMVLYNGTTQTTEKAVNPDSEYLKELPEHLRSYEEDVYKRQCKNSSCYRCNRADPGGNRHRKKFYRQDDTYEQ